MLSLNFFIQSLKMKIISKPKSINIIIINSTYFKVQFPLGYFFFLFILLNHMNRFITCKKLIFCILFKIINILVQMDWHFVEVVWKHLIIYFKRDNGPFDLVYWKLVRRNVKKNRENILGISSKWVTKR